MGGSGSDGWPVAYEYHVGAHKHSFDLRQDPVPVCMKSFHPTDDSLPTRLHARRVDVNCRRMVEVLSIGGPSGATR